MAEDSIFRIFSMSKLVTSVALLQLFEKGLFQLEEPICTFLPKFGKSMVSKASTGPLELEPLVRPITMRHLLTHTSGLSYGTGDGAVDEMYQKSLLWKAAMDPMACSLANFADVLAEMPLKFQPGEGFEYGMSFDLCGRLVEVLSGQPFDEYLKEHIFKPLGMVDTGFTLTDVQASRAVTMYEMNKDQLVPCGKTWAFLNIPEPHADPRMKFGGHGLWSTASDFMRFSLMLNGKGVFEGSRVLSPKTVELMTRNHLPGGVDIAALGGVMPDFPTVRGLGFGLGPAVVLSPDFGMHCSDGSYFWQGAGSTYHLQDVKEELSVVVMTQFMPVFDPAVLWNRFAVASLAQQAIVD